MQQPRVLHADIVPGQVNPGWRGRARTRGRLGGQIQMVQNALDDIGRRDDAQDTQRAPTSQALRNVHREDPSHEKAERLDEGWAALNRGFDLDSGSAGGTYLAERVLPAFRDFDLRYLDDRIYPCGTTRLGSVLPESRSRRCSPIPGTHRDERRPGFRGAVLR
jgi:hypothetical protein